MALPRQGRRRRVTKEFALEVALLTSRENAAQIREIIGFEA